MNDNIKINQNISLALAISDEWYYHFKRKEEERIKKASREKLSNKFVLIYE